MRSDRAPLVRPALRRLHPFALVAEVFRVARGWFVPAVVVGASMGGRHMGRFIAWGLLFLAVVSLLSAVAEYLALRFELRDDEIVLYSGILSRRERVMPLTRMQNVEVRQNAVQRLFNVAEVRVETASGNSDDLVPLVLGKREADRLCELLLAHRVAISSRIDSQGTSAHGPSGTLLARLSPRELVLAGATANEAGVIAAVLAGALSLAYRLPLDLPRPWLEPRTLLDAAPGSGVVGMVLAVAFSLLLLAWLFSIGGALIRYWGFALERSGDELRKQHGLFDRRDVTIPLARVQTLRTEESLLRRLAGLASLKIETAGSHPDEAQRRRTEALLPVARRRDVPRLVSSVFEDVEFDSLCFRPVNGYARRRVFVRYSTFLALLAVGASALLTPMALWLLALMPLGYLAAGVHHRHLGYALPPGYVVVRGGCLNRITWVLPRRKIQTLHLEESPFQRRRGLATVVVDTAGGAVRIPDLQQRDALAVAACMENRPRTRDSDPPDEFALGAALH